MRQVIWLVFSMACAPVAAVVVPVDGTTTTATSTVQSTTDTTTPSTTDTTTASNGTTTTVWSTSTASTDTVTSTTVTSTTTPPPRYDHVWTGRRVFMVDCGWFGACEDTVFETGVEVTADSTFADALAACPSCTQLFEVDVTPDRICSDWLDITNLVVRGVSYASGEAHLYNMTVNGSTWSAEDLGTGAFDGVHFEYSYTGDYWGCPYDVNGETNIE